MGTPLGTQGEHANSTQKRPIADPGQGMGKDCIIHCVGGDNRFFNIHLRKCH